MVFAELPDLGQASEQIQVEHLISQASVEPLDKGVLIRLSWLDAIDKHAVGLAPVDEDAAEELGAIVNSQDIR